MFEHYCSKCAKYYPESEWEDISYYSEYIDACLFEYKIVKCLVCDTEYEVLINDHEEE